MTVTREQLTAVIADLQAMADSLVVVPAPAPIPAPAPAPEPAPPAVKFSWKPTQLSDWSSQQKSPTVNTITQIGEWITFNAPSSNVVNGEAAKCGLEKKSFYPLKSGDILTVEWDQEWLIKPSTYADLFWMDVEDSTDSSVGMRAKYDAKGAPRTDGGKIGAPRWSDPRGLVMAKDGHVKTEWLMHETDGYLRVWLNGVDVFHFKGKTFSGNQSKLQLGFTAQSSGVPQKMRMKGISVEVR